MLSSQRVIVLLGIILSSFVSTTFADPASPYDDPSANRRVRILEQRARAADQRRLRDEEEILRDYQRLQAKYGPASSSLLPAPSAKAVRRGLKRGDPTATAAALQSLNAVSAPYGANGNNPAASGYGPTRGPRDYFYRPPEKPAFSDSLRPTPAKRPTLPETDLTPQSSLPNSASVSGGVVPAAQPEKLNGAEAMPVPSTEPGGKEF